MTALYIAGQGIGRCETTVDHPRPDRLLQGNPQRLTQSLYEHPNMNAGIWQCEVGAWNIVFAPTKQEFFYVLAGQVRLHDQKTQSFVEINTGDAGVIPPGFVGTFEVTQAVKKYFVVVDI
jgi:uncharacterized protein